jgi:hypothetical protein
MNSSGFTSVLQLTHDERMALSLIHDDFRNQFLHYRPTLWSIEVTGMPKVVAHALDVLQRVALEMGGYYAHYDRNKVADLVAGAQELLRQVEYS